MFDSSPETFPPPPADESFPAEVPGVAPIPPPLPRPNLGQAVLIVLGIPVVQLLAMILFMMVAVPNLLSEASGAKSFMDRLPPGQMIRMLGFVQGTFAVAAFFGAWWIFGRRFNQFVPMTLPSGRHLTLIFLLVLPLAVMDGFLAQQVINAGEAVFGKAPSQGDLAEFLNGASRQAPLGVLLLVLAVLPALGEELVFRGVIGRGLIARWGIVAGIFWTSLLFSMVHGNLVQGVGVFFVGVMAHVSYLATRSLAAPILLHFLNNSLAAFALKAIANQSPETRAAADQLAGNLSPWVAVASMICVAVLGSLLWKSRVEYLDDETEVVTQKIPTVEQPASAAFQRCRPVSMIWVAYASAAYLLFLTSAALTIPS